VRGEPALNGFTVKMTFKKFLPIVIQFLFYIMNGLSHEQASVPVLGRQMGSSLRRDESMDGDSA